MDIKKYRLKIKAEMIKTLLDAPALNQEQNITKTELGLRVLKFFEYEQDPEFEKMFNSFCEQKKWKKENNNEGR